MDYACLKNSRKQEYRALLVHSVGLLSAVQMPVANKISADQLVKWLRYLNQPAKRAVGVPELAFLVLSLVLGSLPAFTLAALLETRCFLACYLGY